MLEDEILEAIREREKAFAAYPDAYDLDERKWGLRFLPCKWLGIDGRNTAAVHRARRALAQLAGKGIVAVNAIAPQRVYVHLAETTMFGVVVCSECGEESCGLHEKLKPHGWAEHGEKRLCRDCCARLVQHIKQNEKARYERACEEAERNGALRACGGGFVYSDLAYYLLKGSPCTVIR
jgi:hypothetical protein